MNSDTIKQFQNPLPESKYKYLVTQLYEALKWGENSVLICPPLFGRDHNVNYIRQRTQYQKKILEHSYQRFKFININLLNTHHYNLNIWLKQLSLSDQPINSLKDLGNQLGETINQGLEIVYFINIPETLNDSDYQEFLELAQKIYYLAPARIHFLLIFDMRWNEEDFFKLSNPYRSLFQNVTQLSLYSDQEIRHFIHHLLERWNYQLSKKVIDYIIDQSGGIMLFAKACLRVAFKAKKTALTDIKAICQAHPDFIIQIKFFYFNLTNTQQQIIKNIANAKRIKNKSELKHLIKLTILNETASTIQIRSKALAYYLSDFIFDVGKIKHRIISLSIYSDREKELLIELLNHQGQIVSRDKIATILWKNHTEEKYSAWAIDQTISRLRKKLKLSDNLQQLKIKAKKKQGFLLNLN